MRSGHIYRHLSTYASCDLYVVKIQYQDYKYVKLRGILVSRASGTFMGDSFGIKLLTINMSDWSLL